MKKFVLTILIALSTIWHAYGENTNRWNVGIYDIKSYDTTTSSIAKSVKSSMLLILSKNFNMIRIEGEITDKKEILKMSLKEKIDFAIYGFVMKKDDKTYTLVLQLQDIANETIKLSRDYSFVYDPEMIFDTIDKIISDFSDGILRVVPKYQEEIAVEYRKKLQTKETLFKVPGNFLVSININNSTTFQRYNVTNMVYINNVYPSISFKYLNDTEGGIFGNGWFSYINIPDFITSIEFKSEILKQRPTPKFTGKSLEIGIGTKFFNFFGMGIEFLFFRQFNYIVSIPNTEDFEFKDIPLSMSLYPSLYIVPFKDIQILSSVAYYSREGLSLVLRFMRDDDNYNILENIITVTVNPIFKISENISIDTKIQYNFVKTKVIIDGNPILTAFDSICLSIGFSKRFYF